MVEPGLLDMKIQNNFFMYYLCLSAIVYNSAYSIMRKYCYWIFTKMQVPG